MIATFDTETGLVVIDLGSRGSAVDSIDPHPRAILAVDESGEAVQIEISAAGGGVDEPLRAVAEHTLGHGRPLDYSLLVAAASAALAAPDQTVNVSFSRDAA